MYDDDRIRWDSYEFNYREKTRDWFWAVGIITISASVIFMIYDNISFGIFIILAGVILSFSAQKKPAIVEFELNQKGLFVGGNLIPMSTLYSYYIEERKFAPPRLLIRSNRKIAPILVVPIETDFVDAETIRGFLEHFLPEEKLHESLSHKLLESLGF